MIVTRLWDEGRRARYVEGIKVAAPDSKIHLSSTNTLLVCPALPETVESSTLHGESAYRCQILILIIIQNFVLTA